jgi:hypothetical protein
MEQKNKMFSKSYKTGVTVFMVLILLISVITYNIVKGVRLNKKSSDDNKVTIQDKSVDTVRIEVPKIIKDVDTIYVTCRKKHCEESHQIQDTIK